MEQAVGQLLLNAIKYAYGQTVVEIALRQDAENAIVSVTNKGIPLPQGLELKDVWDFGFRGRSAKEYHVNGSGIGLYTV